MTMNIPHTSTCRFWQKYKKVNSFKKKKRAQKLERDSRFKQTSVIENRRIKTETPLNTVPAATTI